MAATVGIDVHKATLVIACHPSGEQWTTATTPAALAALADRLTALAPTVIVLEPSGGYERPVCATLQQAGLPVARVNGARIRGFAQQKGIRAKADHLDARVLALFGAAEQPVLLTPQDATAQLHHDLVTRRRQLVEQISAEQHRRACVSPVVVASLDRTITLLRTEVATIEQLIAETVATDPRWTLAQTTLATMGGIGPATTRHLLLLLPELGHVTGKRLACLAGVAPITKQSGTSVDHGHIDGGRTEVRTTLWMPVLSMVTRGTNPTIATFAQRLLARGKPFHLVMIACLRKVLVTLNAMVRDGTDWHPSMPRTP